MSLLQLSVHQLRNLQHIDLQPCSGVNIFHGANGSGKTSVLEAIHFLATTRTFRSRGADPLINHEATSTTVFGRIVDQDDRIRGVGVSRDRKGGREVSVDGQRQHMASQLAELLPVRVFGPDSVNLLLGSPEQRRQFLNWGMFHVEHDFWPSWKQASHCLKQRNALLKQPRVDRQQLMIWDDQLAGAGTRLHDLRLAYMSKLAPIATNLIEKLLGQSGLELHYAPGWAAGKDLADCLAQQAESDIERGYTNSGHHRAEIRVKLRGREIQDMLSRGELKLVAWGLIMAQGRVNDQQSRKRVCFLIDDLAAELDSDKRSSVRKELALSNAQLFVTTVAKETEIGDWGDLESRMFHVKHGTILQEEQLNE